MAVSPSGVGFEAPGIWAMACTKVRVRGSKGLSLDGLIFGGIGKSQRKRPGPYRPGRLQAKALVVLVPPAAAEPMSPMPAAAKAESKGNAGAVIIGIGRIVRRRIVISRRGRAIAITRAIGRRAITGRRRVLVIAGGALVL